MNKTSLFIKKIIPFGILFLLTPLCASAEAGKGITDESIILALSGFLVIVINQIFLIITSFKKIINPENKSSILHFISFAIAIIIASIFIPNAGSGELAFLFKAFVILPLVLGIISFLISVFNWVKKKN